MSSVSQDSAADGSSNSAGGRERVLLFGGSFDPIHHGHLISAVAIAERIGAGRVILIPSGRPPHKLERQLASGAQRVEMCRLAVAGDARFEVSDWELTQAGPNYTLLTVRHFREALPGAALYWLIGMDSLLDLPTWYRVGELADACTLVTAARPGYEKPDWAKLAGTFAAAQIERLAAHVFETPRVEVDATALRRRVRAGESIRYFVPERVEEFVRGVGLYR